MGGQATNYLAMLSVGQTLSRVTFLSFFFNTYEEGSVHIESYIIEIVSYGHDFSNSMFNIIKFLLILFTFITIIHLKIFIL